MLENNKGEFMLVNKLRDGGYEIKNSSLNKIYFLSNDELKFKREWVYTLNTIKEWEKHRAS